MARRCSVHDYTSRCFYLVTTTVVNRQPLLGRLVGNSQAETPDGRPSIVLSPLGEAVMSSWLKLPDYYATVSVVAAQVMPNHFHGIIFFKESSDLHLGHVMRGFKTGCNRAYRELVQGTSMPHSDGLLWNNGYNDRILTHYGGNATWPKILCDWLSSVSIPICSVCSSGPMLQGIKLMRLAIVFCLIIPINWR